MLTYRRRMGPAMSSSPSPRGYRAQANPEPIGNYGGCPDRQCRERKRGVGGGGARPQCHSTRSAAGPALALLRARAGDLRRPMVVMRLQRVNALEADLHVL